MITNSLVCHHDVVCSVPLNAVGRQRVLITGSSFCTQRRSIRTIALYEEQECAGSTSTGPIVQSPLISLSSPKLGLRYIHGCGTDGVVYIKAHVWRDLK